MIVLGATAHAATFGQLPTLGDLDRLSRAVVTGTVTSAQTEVAPWGLVTTYDIAVTAVLNGDAGSTLRVQLPGGHRDHLTQRYPGVPDWSPGDQVLVFVPRTGVLPLTGVFSVVDGFVVDPLARFPEAMPLSGVAGLVGRGHSFTP